MSRVAKLKRWLRYESEANRLVLSSLESVPVEQCGGDEHRRGLAAMAHIQIARRTWLARLQGRVPEAVADWFPAWEVDRTRREAAALDEAWSAYVGGLDEPDLDRTITYRNIEGREFTNTIDDILTHVFNHSTYHRGQVARAVTACGGKRADTDFILLVRQGLVG